MRKLRVGVIGVGSIAGVAHLPNYAKRDDIDVVAFADPEVDRASKKASAFAAEYSRPVPTVYASVEDLFAHEQLDAVSVCTPNTSHVECALKALSAGVHVLLEKPMATSLADADRLLSAALKSDKLLMVGMSHRYRDDVTAIKRFVDNGDLGDVYYAKTRILRRRGTPTGWFSDEAISGGGPLLDIGVHALDLTWWLLGQPVIDSVNGFLRRGIGKDNLDFIETWAASSSGNEHNEVYTTEDFASAFLRFKNGAALQLEVSWAVNGPQDDALKVELFGSKGGISLDPLRFYGSSHGVLTETSLPVGMGDLYETEINHFVDSIQTGSSLISDAAQGRAIVQMLTAIKESSERKQEIRL